MNPSFLLRIDLEDAIIVLPWWHGEDSAGERGLCEGERLGSGSGMRVPGVYVTEWKQEGVESLKCGEFSTYIFKNSFLITLSS